MLVITDMFMKTLVPLLGGTLAFVMQAYPQASVNVANFYIAGGIRHEAPITNSLTGARLVGGTNFMVQLYGGPEGITDDSQLVPVGPQVSFIQQSLGAGFFGPRNVTLPWPSATVQVRIWEVAYGADYEAASAAPLMNSRTALLGKSQLLHVPAPNYDPSSPPPPPVNLVQLGMVGFALETTWTPSLFINDLVISEGTNGTKQAMFTVRLGVAGLQNVSVDYATADGTAVAGSDYTATSGTLNFAPGETNKTVVVSVTADVAVENDEVFYVNLGNAVNAPVLKGQGSCVITEVRVTDIRLDVAVSFNTVSGHSYTVEKTDDGVNWSAVTGAENVPGTGAIVSVYDQGGGAQPQRMYRARLLE